MALTISLTGEGCYLVDSTNGTSRLIIPCRQSLAITEQLNQTIVVADATTDSALAFGGVSAAKILALTTSAEVSVKINGGTTAIPVESTLVIVASDGDVTSASISNASGGSATVTYLVAG